MAHELPSPADVVRSSAETTRRLAASFRCRDEVRYAEHLEQRAAIADERALYLDHIARVRAAPGGTLEVALIDAHAAAVRVLEEGGPSTAPSARPSGARADRGAERSCRAPHRHRTAW